MIKPLSKSHQVMSLSFREGIKVGEEGALCRGRPLMIWGGGSEEIEKKNLGGPSPGKKISKGLPQENKSQEAFSRKK